MTGGQRTMTDDQADRGPVPIWVSALRRRWGWLVAGLVVGVLAAVGYQQIANPSYEASTQVVVRPVLTDPFGTNATDPTKSINMPTEVQVASSTGVAQAAANQLHSNRSAKDLLRHVSITSPSASQILSITYTDSAAAAAAKGANAFASAYLADRSSRIAATVTHMATALNKQARSLTAQRKVLDTALATDVGTQHDADVSQRSLVDTELASLATQQTQLAALDKTPGYVSAAATPPGHRSGPSTTLLLAAGGLIGLLVGLVVAQLRDATDDRVRDVGQVADALGVRVLTGTPLSMQRRGLPGEASRAIGLQLLNGGADQRCVLVLSGLSGEGRTAVTASLATAIAQMGRRVVAVSADFLRPGLHRAFGLPAAPGLAEELRGGPPLSGTVADLPGLRVVTSGNGGGDRAMLARYGTEFQSSADRWSVGSDLVLIDTPPLLAAADALAAAPAADAGLVVVALGRSTRAGLRQLRSTVESLGLPIIGAVVLRPGRRAGTSRTPVVIRSGRGRLEGWSAPEPFAATTDAPADTAIGAAGVDGPATADRRDGQVPATRRSLPQPAGSPGVAGRDTPSD